MLMKAMITTLMTMAMVIGDDDDGGGGGGDGGGDEESHDDDNEQTERRFSVSAFTSCHAETQRERGRRERIARQEHRHHPPPSQHQLCFALHILFIIQPKDVVHFTSCILH